MTELILGGHLCGSESTLKPIKMHYRDTGCSLAPRCLECPLPRCRYDEPTPARVNVRQARVVISLERVTALERAAKALQNELRAARRG